MNMPTDDVNAAPLDAARRVIDANTYLTLATADVSGTPWATPVWFAEHELREYFWVSRLETRHSQNIAARPEVALAVFDSTVAVGSAIAVYVDGVAGEVSADDLEAGLEVYGAKSEARGIRRWTAADVTGSAPFRLFRATASQVFVLDERERRVPVL
ncbi:pyridoxamine 5'-phosphate oxidase family protein [Agromyces lapidis]|uniref:Pyridoxamine 5'-phosphate oxidase family protein n=1 Tax=Agromyces lapidis TaxID=279574 RepID=A0ABV5SLT0_9MICO|nr:pyridoxamine 5'-phosphate oxidase family protein [Agromyces lapidis]